MRIVFWLVALLLVFVAQTTAYHLFPWLPVMPDLALALALFAGLRWGAAGGLRFGAAAGLFQDLLLSGTLGFGFFSKAVTGFTVGWLRERYLTDWALSRAIMAAAATLADLMIFDALIKGLYGLEFAENPVTLALWRIPLNVAAVLALLPLLEAADRKLAARSAWRNEEMPTLE